MSETIQSQEEFTKADEGFTRRGFVKVAVGGVGLAYAAAVGYPVYRFLNSPVEKSASMAAVHEVSLKDADKLPKGAALVFKFGVRPAMLIHHSDDTWVALDAVCSHMGCTVSFDAPNTRIVCQCHGGVYDAHTGDNVSGPPPRPLKKFVAKIEPGLVTVTRA